MVETRRGSSSSKPLRQSLSFSLSIEHQAMDSIFQGIRSRELTGFRVRKPPYIGDKATDFAEFKALAVEHSGEETPPLAISFGKTSKNSHILAVSDEDGFVSLFDSRKKFSVYAYHQECSDKARISDWVAHQTAIFDICWLKEDTTILSASGDQTIKVWDAQEKKCTGVLMGHTGSIKSICPHPTNSGGCYEMHFICFGYAEATWSIVMPTSTRLGLTSPNIS